MRKMESIQKEYGIPFERVVLNFSLAGYSKRRTAASLDINLSYFRQLLTKYNLHKLFKRCNYNNLCRPVGKGRPKGSPGTTKIKYTDDFLFKRRKQFPTTYLFNKNGPPFSSTLQRRFGSFYAKERTFL